MRFNVYIGSSSFTEKYNIVCAEQCGDVKVELLDQNTTIYLKVSEFTLKYK